jgi:hypothetical protein
MPEEGGPMTLHANNSPIEHSVFDVARDLEKEAAAANLKPYQLAKKRIVECSAAGNREGARFWRNVLLDAVLIAQGQRDVQLFRDD